MYGTKKLQIDTFTISFFSLKWKKTAFLPLVFTSGIIVGAVYTGKKQYG